MSVYSTIHTHNFGPDMLDGDWFISVAVFPVPEPVRINHADEEWFLTQEDARRLLRALEEVVVRSSE